MVVLCSIISFLFSRKVLSSGCYFHPIRRCVELFLLHVFPFLFLWLTMSCLGLFLSMWVMSLIVIVIWAFWLRQWIRCCLQFSFGNDVRKVSRRMLFMLFFRWYGLASSGLTLIWHQVSSVDSYWADDCSYGRSWKMHGAPMGMSDSNRNWVMQTVNFLVVIMDFQ